MHSKYYIKTKLNLKKKGSHDPQENRKKGNKKWEKKREQR